MIMCTSMVALMMTFIATPYGGKPMFFVWVCLIFLSLLVCVSECYDDYVYQYGGSDDDIHRYAVWRQAHVLRLGLSDIPLSLGVCFRVL